MRRPSVPENRDSAVPRATGTLISRPARPSTPVQMQTAPKMTITRLITGTTLRFEAAWCSLTPAFCCKRHHRRLAEPNLLSSPMGGYHDARERLSAAMPR